MRYIWWFEGPCDKSATSVLSFYNAQPKWWLILLAYGMSLYHVETCQLSQTCTGILLSIPRTSWIKSKYLRAFRLRVRCMEILNCQAIKLLLTLTVRRCTVESRRLPRGFLICVFYVDNMQSAPKISISRVPTLRASIQRHI